jgi:hypothetical protein
MKIIECHSQLNFENEVSANDESRFQISINRENPKIKKIHLNDVFRIFIVLHYFLNVSSKI